MGLSGESGIPELLRIGPQIAILPVIHGSGQFALTVRRWMLEQSFDCVAVPLPESFRDPVEEAGVGIATPLDRDSARDFQVRIELRTG